MAFLFETLGEANELGPDFPLDGIAVHVFSLDFLKQNVYFGLQQLLLDDQLLVGALQRGELQVLLLEFVHYALEFLLVLLQLLDLLWEHALVFLLEYYLVSLQVAQYGPVQVVVYEAVELHCEAGEADLEVYVQEMTDACAVVGEEFFSALDLALQVEHFFVAQDFVWTEKILLFLKDFVEEIEVPGIV